ncbi:MAG: hypothetical protein EXR71_06960 [Myxococcales bacterium]|nr:hypothetical protein [Myxococcales bacterium]
MLLLLITLSRADAPTDDGWLARGDAAAAEVARTARLLAELGDAIAAEGRAVRFAELHTGAATLVKRCAALRSAIGDAP